MAHAKFHVLTTTAGDLQNLLASNKITSVEIVTQYLAQIELHEPKLNAFISLAPRESLLRIAASLDEERLLGQRRSPLHGIPIVLKDVFITDSNLGMGTTAGSCALVGAKASKNSAIAQRLIDAGLIILGKTNMTEFAGMKTGKMMPGWSAVGGQTISPYVGPIQKGETLLGHSAPGGSSIGSAVAVAAGFSPLAIGTETIGSIITPATRAALYAIKPTVGVQDVSGMYTLTDFFDSPGPMAKSANDLLTLTEILLGDRYSRDEHPAWGGLSVGFLDPEVWKMAEAMCRQYQKTDGYEGTAEQMTKAYHDFVRAVEAQGCVVKPRVELADLSQLAIDGEDAIMPIAFWDFKNICIPRFLASFDEVSVGDLAGIIKFNEENKERCLPAPFDDQSDLIKALRNDDTAERISPLKEKLRKKAKEILDTAMSNADVDIIAAPGDSPLCVHAAAAGYPVATMPLGQLQYNGRPFGICLVAKSGNEDALLRFMSGCQRYVLDDRPVPVL